MVAMLAAAALGAQATSVTTVTATNPQLSLQAFVDPEVVAPNSQVAITFAVTPGRRMHVYAPGAEYQVVAVKLDAQQGLKARPVVYPPAETYYFEPLDERVPVYTKPFTLKQLVTVGASALKGKKILTLSGQLEYQACDDRVCFKPNAIPFTFELPVKR
jgi:DsbC/DsbD-like thiol-disulfide interchange protein